MGKKLFSMVLAAMIILSAGATTIFAASETEDTSTTSKIYFDVNSSDWKDFSKIYCHIWTTDGVCFTDWQTKKELCTKEENGLYSYDLTKWSDFTGKEIKETDGKEYCVIFSSDTGAQTYDTIMSGSCIGDTVYVIDPDTKLENPVDSEKSVIASGWKNNKDCGPHKTITSTGNVIGTALAENETDADLLADYLVVYSVDNEKISNDIVLSLINKLSVSKEDLTVSVEKKLQSNYTEDERNKILATLSNKGYILEITEPTTLPETTTPVTEPETTTQSVSTSATVSTNQPTTTNNNTPSNNSQNTVKSGESSTTLFVLLSLLTMSFGTFYISAKKTNK